MTRLRPSRFARYRLSSASLMNCATSTSSPSIVATPTDTVTGKLSPSYSNGASATMRRTCSANVRAPVMSVSGSTAANSSPPQRARHLAQHVVAGEVAVLVVDLLEVVDVEHQQRQRPAVARAACDLALEELEEVALVVGAGQGVHDRHPVDLFVVARLDAGAGQELEDRGADLEEVGVAQHALGDRHVVDIR